MKTHATPRLTRSLQVQRVAIDSLTPDPRERAEPQRPQPRRDPRLTGPVRATKATRH